MFDNIIGTLGETRTDLSTGDVYRLDGTDWVLNGTGTPSSAGFPTTDLTVGDIREHLATGTKYRWSGSAWVIFVEGASTIDGAMIKSGTIASDKIADSAITSAKIADATITRDDIHDDTMTTIKDAVLPTLDSAIKDSVTQLTVTLSELAAAATITKSNDGGFTVCDTVTPTTLYVVSEIAPGVTNDLVVLTVADMTASAAQGVTVKYAATGNGTVTDVNANALATDATGVAVSAWA